MKWPRGRYNGERIGGVTLKIEVNFAWWTAPKIYIQLQPYSLHFGPLHIWAETAYGHERHDR